MTKIRNIFKRDISNYFQHLERYMKPLEGIKILEFAQFMAGPSAGLKSVDLGARVIKIERSGTGEARRQIAIKNSHI